MLSKDHLLLLLLLLLFCFVESSMQTASISHQRTEA
jgi:hypothetical protein